MAGLRVPRRPGPDRQGRRPGPSRDGRPDREGGRPGPDRPAGRLDAWLLAGLAAAAYTAFAVTQWRRLEVPSWDLGIFTQLAKAYAALEAPVVPIKGHGFNLLGDHFHPILVLLGPVYRLFPSGLSLLVLQALLLAVSAVPVTRVAQERLGRGLGTALGAVYVLSWGLQGALAAQFHEIAFAVPLLAAALAAFLRGRWWASAAWAAPLVLVKEDLGLTVAALGLLVLWRGHRAARWPGVGLAGWGAAWFLLATFVLVPALSPEGRWVYADNLGDGGGLGLLAELVTPAEKVRTVLVLVATGGVVALRSPLVLLAVPTLAWRFLGDVPFYWGTDWHYSAVLMPVAVAALLDAVGRTGRRLAVPAVAVSAATVLVMLPTQPLARLVEPATYAPAARHEAAEEVLTAIPDGATVGSDLTLMAYLVPTTTVYWVGNAGDPPPQYVVVDALGASWGGEPPPDTAAWAEEHYPGTEYTVVLRASGYEVARRS